MEIFTAELIGQQLFYGLILGAVYVLMAVGFSLIWGIMDMLNFSHGEFFMLGGYFTFFLFQYLNLNPIVAVFLAMIITGAMAALMFNFIVFPINRKPNWLTNTIIITLGISISLQNLALLVFGERYKIMPKFINYNLKFWDISIGADRLVILAFALVVIFVLWVFIQKSNIGVAMQAIAQSKVAAQIMGLPIKFIYLITFAVSCSLAAAAGGLLAPIYSIYPTVGFMPMLMAFLVVILGGLGSVKGAILAGFMLGVVESFTVLFISAAWKEVAMFALMIIILSVRPAGLFGTRGT